MSIRKNKSLNRKIVSSSVSVIISLSLVLFVLGLLSLFLINAQRLTNYVKENIGFSIMIKENIKEIELIEFNKILDGESFTKSTEFISKEAATKDLENELGEDFVNFLGFNPIMASIDVKLNSSYANNDSLNNISSLLQKNKIVHEVYYQKNLIEKLNNNIRKISFFLFAFSLILFFIAFALINNTIRLSVYSKRFVIRTMSLVGAESQFIQKPFLINAIYQGLYSAIFAVFLLIGSIQLIQKETASILNINDLQIIGIVFIVLFCSGVIISVASTFFAVRRFIYSNEDELYN